MALNNDAWPLPVLFAVLMLCLAKAMGAEKSERPTVQKISHADVQVAEASDGECLGLTPEFSLKDPVGKEFGGDELCRPTGMLVMLTAPTLTQYEKQKKWEKVMNRQRWPKSAAPRRVLIEDLSQQNSYKEKARAMMKQAYKSDGEMAVLIDESGDVRRAFGVQNDETVIVLCDAHGRILHIVSDDVEPNDSAAQKLSAQVNRLADHNAKSLQKTATLSLARK
jgi:hypothetical protein